MSEPHRVERTLRRWNDALLAGDLDTFGAGISPDATFEDRRMGLGASLDREGLIEQGRVIVDLGTEAIDLETIDARGDDIALIRFNFHLGADFTVPMLVIVALDAEGRAQRTIVFDEDAIDAARAELDTEAG